MINSNIKYNRCAANYSNWQDILFIEKPHVTYWGFS